MKKQFKVSGLDCANCARKIEDLIKKQDGVLDVRLNFLTQKILLEFDGEITAELMKDFEKLARKIEREFKIEA